MMDLEFLQEEQAWMAQQVVIPKDLIWSSYDINYLSNAL